MKIGLLGRGVGGYYFCLCVKLPFEIEIISFFKSTHLKSVENLRKMDHPMSSHCVTIFLFKPIILIMVFRQEIVLSKKENILEWFWNRTPHILKILKCLWYIIVTYLALVKKSKVIIQAFGQGDYDLKLFLKIFFFGLSGETQNSKLLKILPRYLQRV